MGLGGDGERWKRPNAPKLYIPCKCKHGHAASGNESVGFGPCGFQAKGPKFLREHVKKAQHRVSEGEQDGLVKEEEAEQLR